MDKLVAIILLLLGAGFSAARADADQIIHAFTPESFQQIKSAHQGKAFVVMVWSLDCAYCDESFAALAQAQRQHGIAVVTIAMDRVDDNEIAASIRRKLQASGLRGEMWAAGPAPAEQIRYAIDPKWRGEMPRTYWFTPAGNAAGYSGVVTPKIVDRFL